MHIDARHLDDQSHIEGDICIVGAGAAGISIALQWINTPYKVILLEGGGFEYDDRVQELYRGKTTGQKYYPLKSSRLHYFGGTTGHWGGFCSVFEPVVFQKRDWVNESGWPFTHKELEQFYKRAHDVLDIGEYGFELDHWLKQDSSLVPLPLDKDVFYSKIWRFRYPSAMRFGTDYRDAIVNAKNIHLYNYANVTEIHTNESVSAVTEMTVKNYAGKTHTVSAKYFVLAGCAIQNARLLLASGKQASNGLGNDYDLVGRYFMENAEIKSAELWLRERSELKLYMRNSEPNVRAELAMTPQKQEELKILNGILSFTPLEKARKTPPYISSWSSEDPREDKQKIAEINEQATEEKNRIVKLFEEDGYESFEITLRLEQVPNSSSRVTLDNEKDELGVPRAHLHWAFTPLEKRSIRTIYTLLGQQVGAKGIGRVKLLEDIQDEKDDNMPASTSGGWHHQGTTRMSDDPRKGVVDADCKVHGIHNLYIAGSSCFPNGGAVNPTFTIVALSIRLSDHLKQIIQTENISDMVRTGRKHKKHS
ncbi:MAG: GMC family oxidoreductase [Chitinophagaceae bacterium]|nr:GMC family oxidoreductase [Chitinophagaceae bacterium]